MAGIDQVVGAVEKVFDIPAKELLRRGNRGCEARQILLYLAAVHCRGRYTLSVIGEPLGPLTISGLDSARHKMASRLKEDPPLRRKVEQVEKILEELADKSKSED